MKVGLQCERCEEECVGFAEFEADARKRAAKSLEEHLRWFHGQELVKEYEAAYAEKAPLPEAEEGREHPVEDRLGTLVISAKTQSQTRMLEALATCWIIILERSAKYNEAWLNRGAIGGVLEILKLSDRIKAQLWDSNIKQGDMDVDLDDLYDLLNYTLACISQAKQGHWTHG